MAGLPGRTLLALTLLTAPVEAAKLTEYDLDPGTNPAFLVVAADGNVWFTEYLKNRIGRITPAGAIDHFDTGIVGCGPVGITIALGILQYACTGAYQIGSLIVRSDGTVLSTPSHATSYRGTVISSTGGETAWFHDATNAIQKNLFTNDEIVVPFTVSDHVNAIVENPDGSAMATEPGNLISVYYEPAIDTWVWGRHFVFGSPYAIAWCPAFGTWWYTDASAGSIVEWVSNSKTEHVLPGSGRTPEGIACAPDGSIWYTDAGANMVGRLKPDRTTFEEVPLTTAGAIPYGITIGPDGSAWFAENQAQKIGRIQVRPPGDANGDGTVDVSDVFYLINFLFAGGAAPVPQ